MATPFFTPTKNFTFAHNKKITTMGNLKYIALNVVLLCCVTFCEAQTPKTDTIKFVYTKYTTAQLLPKAFTFVTQTTTVNDVMANLKTAKYQPLKDKTFVISLFDADNKRINYILTGSSNNNIITQLRINCSQVELAKLMPYIGTANYNNSNNTYWLLQTKNGERLVIKQSLIGNFAAVTISIHPKTYTLEPTVQN